MQATTFTCRPATGVRFMSKSSRSVVVRSGAINPSIDKDNPKVVNTVDPATFDKPQVAYCRCWRSGTFPLCDGSHVKHNKDTGDNVGPLLVKKPAE